jgi:peptidoglycan hydrolase-like protein with peptidoglycan-binding domain
VLLAGKVAWAGIVFIVLATGISGPRLAPPDPGTDLSPELPAAGNQNEIIKMQESLRDKGHYQSQVDGVFGLRSRASIRAYQKAENLPVTGQLDTQTAGKLGVRPESREETGGDATKGKPSAGIKWAKGSRRTGKPVQKAVTARAAPDSSRAAGQKTLQADSSNHPQ